MRKIDKFPEICILPRLYDKIIKKIWIDQWIRRLNQQSNLHACRDTHTWTHRQSFINKLYCLGVCYLSHGCSEITPFSVLQDHSSNGLEWPCEVWNIKLNLDFTLDFTLHSELSFQTQILPISKGDLFLSFSHSSKKLWGRNLTTHLMGLTWFCQIR